MATPFESELVLLWVGVGGYAGGVALAWYDLHRPRKTNERLLLFVLAASAALFLTAIVVRWLHLGHGPFLTMYEILLSNLFSLGAIFTLLYWRVAATRCAASVILPILLLLGVWILDTPSTASALPATYDNPWLWVHVGIGKFFLGACLVATGIAGVLLMRQAGVARAYSMSPWTPAVLDRLAWRFMSLAFVFHSFMLIAGAVWAQDAWGRYWAWDPLETWAFITWLSLAVCLHLRLTYKVPPQVGWWMILGTFCIAFLTFFGVPFVSLAPHKGIL